MREFDFLATYAHLSTTLGWSYDQCRELTFKELKSLTDYWSEYPPVHIILKAVYQVGKHKQDDNAELENIKRNAPKFVPPIPIKDASHG